MYILEYAQNMNGKFHGWIVSGAFPTQAEAIKVAVAHGLTREGDDFLVSESEEEV